MKNRARNEYSNWTFIITQSYEITSTTNVFIYTDNRLRLSIKWPKVIHQIHTSLVLAVTLKASTTLVLNINVGNVIAAAATVATVWFAWTWTLAWLSVLSNYKAGRVAFTNNEEETNTKDHF